MYNALDVLHNRCLADTFVIQGTSSSSGPTSPSKKDANAAQITPLERHLLDAGPIREDGSDKFWGFENVSAAMSELFGGSSMLI